MESREKPVIGSGTRWLMIGVALMIDLTQALINLIPIVGQIISALISIFAGLSFIFWFKIKGVSLGTPQRFLRMGSGVLIESIPIINMLPGWTFAVYLTIRTTR